MNEEIIIYKREISETLVGHETIKKQKANNNLLQEEKKENDEKKQGEEEKVHPDVDTDLEGVCHMFGIKQRVNSDWRVSFLCKKKFFMHYALAFIHSVHFV